MLSDNGVKIAQSEARDFQKRLERIEELIAAIDACPDQSMRARTRELVQTLLELHASSLNRVLETIFDSSSSGQRLINELAENDLVSNLLLLHGLHPLDLETRVRAALDKVQPRLGLHGGSVNLLGVTPEGTVRLQLAGNCEGCPSSRMTLKYSIEEALYAAAPDIAALEVDGLVAEHAPATANPKFAECPSPNGNGHIPQEGGNR
ncbi:MAG: NifU family protein [Chthoniobacterales bacterium]|nr:MAG: NifU family protein [Chthoniobacterales bacterium]